MTDNNHKILYIMRHIDVGGHIDIPYKKIGVTGKGNADLTARLRQLSNTKSPIQVQCIKAWEFENATEIESAFHSILKNERSEGEWFYDKEDDLLDRISPIIELLNGISIAIDGGQDLFTKTILKEEEKKKNEVAEKLIGELASKIRHSMRSSIRNAGPTFFSDKTELTYYINMRKSGLHNLDFGRTRDKLDKLLSFLKESGFDTEIHDRGYPMIFSINTDTIAEIINDLENRFISYVAST
jgi:hypothetical protein